MAETILSYVDALTKIYSESIKATVRKRGICGKYEGGASATEGGVWEAGRG